MIIFTKLAAPVELGALDERRGNAGEKLLCQKNIVRRDDAGENERGIGVRHLQLVGDEDIERHLRHLIGDHHCHKYHAEQPAAAFEVDL